MRKIGALLTVGLLLTALVSCSSKDSSDVSSGPSSTENDAGSGAETPASDDAGGTDEGSGSGSGGSGSDSSGGVGLFNLEDCAAVSAMFVTLGLGAAFLSDDQRAEIEQQLGDVQARVPAELQDDIETIRDGAADASNLSELGEFLDSPQYEEAAGNVQQYLEQNCGAG